MVAPSTVSYQGKVTYGWMERVFAPTSTSNASPERGLATVMASDDIASLYGAVRVSDEISRVSFYVKWYSHCTFAYNVPIEQAIAFMDIYDRSSPFVVEGELVRLTPLTTLNRKRKRVIPRATTSSIWQKDSRN